MEEEEEEALEVRWKGRGEKEERRESEEGRERIGGRGKVREWGE